MSRQEGADFVAAAFAVPHPPVILPEVGRGGETQIARTREAYRAAMEQAAALGPETVVVLSPHSVLYADYFHISPGGSAFGDLSQFHAPGVRVDVSYDEDFVAGLAERCEMSGVPAGTLGERDPRLDHGTLIPLRFLQETGAAFKTVRIGLSGLPPLTHYRLGQCIVRTAGELGRRIVIVASGDLSHKLKADGPYGFAPEGPAFDRLVTECLGSGDFLSLLELDPEFSEAAAECGLRAFWIMAGALDRKAVESRLLSYEGPFGVGYGVAAFRVTGEDPDRDFDRRFGVAERARLEAERAAEGPFARLARLGLETHVRTGRPADLPEGLPPELTDRAAGVFVSLKKDGRLRGCIGTIEPTRPSVAEEILRNAVSAGLQDSRFDPVTEEELESLSYSVDVLGTPEPAAEEELDPARYGVIVAAGRRRGLLLPDLPGVDTPEAQLAIARRKAGIGPREDAELWRFEVVRHR